MKLHRIVVAAVLAVSFNAFAQAAKPAEPAKKADEKAKPAEAAKPAEPAKKADEKAKPAEAAKKEAPPAPPTLPPEGKKFVESFLGNWKAADAVMTMGDKSLKGKLTLKCDKTSNGWGAICTGKGDMGKELPPMNVTFLYGWNIGEGEGTMFEVSDSAEVHFHHGKWTDDKNITLTHEGKTAEGKMEKDAVTYTFVSAKEATFKAEGTSEGKTVWTFAATMKK